MNCRLRNGYATVHAKQMAIKRFAFYWRWS